MSVEAMTRANAVKGLSHLEFRVLMCFANIANEDGFAWPSHETVAERCETRRESVQRICMALEDRGILKIVNRTRENGGKTSNIVQLFPPREAVEMPVENGSDVTSDHMGGCDVRSHGDVTSDHIHKNKTNYNKQTNSPAQATTAFISQIIEAAGDALSPDAPEPTELAAMADAEPVLSQRKILKAAREAGQWHLNRTGERSMYSWWLALKKAREMLADAQRHPAAAQPAATGGRARQGTSSRGRKASKPFKTVADPNREVRRWTGPPDIRRAVATAMGEDRAISCIDQSLWVEGTIITPSQWALDKLNEVRGLDQYRKRFDKGMFQ